MPLVSGIGDLDTWDYVFVVFYLLLGAFAMVGVIVTWHYILRGTLNIWATLKTWANDNDF